MGRDLRLPGAAFQVTVARQNEAPQLFPLAGLVMIAGRGAESDLVLDASGVSRQHARLERTIDGWQVVDLGSTNGTFIERNRLLAGVAEPWEKGRALRIGPFFLHWQENEASDAAPSTTAAAAPAGAAGATVPPAGGSLLQTAAGRVAVTLQPTVVTLRPGSASTAVVTLFNQGATVERYELSVEGVDASWATVTPPALQLMPGARAAAQIRFLAPEDGSAAAGSHRFRLRLSASDGDGVVVNGELQMAGFVRFAADMRPTHLQSGQTARLVIHNQGNRPVLFNVSGRDPAEAVTFTPAQRQLTVPAGGKETLDIRAAARHQSLLGTANQLPFSVHVSAEDGEARAFPGLLQNRPRFPRWLPTALLAVLLPLCLAAVALGVWQFGGDDEPTATAPVAVIDGFSGTVTPDLTATFAAQQEAAAAAEAQAATAAAATVAAAEAQAAGDDDGDGLSNADEATLGTDPAAADSDGDGLSDGEEVNVHGSDPLAV